MGWAITDTGLVIELDKQIWHDSNMPTGFVNRTDSTLSFVDATRVFTIAPAVTSFSYYRSGKKITKSAAANVTLADTTQLNYIYFGTDDVLVATTIRIFGDGRVFVATVYYDTTNNKGRVCDERHGFVMDWATQREDHNTAGVKYESGFALSFADDTHTIGLGIFHDEDIKLSIGQQTTSIVLYRMTAGAPSTWTWDAANAKYYKEDGGSDVYYDNAGTLTAAGANQYTCMWIFVSNDKDNPTYAVMGQRVDTTIADASANNTIEGLDLTGLPSQEMLLLARVILRNDATPYEEIEDYRASGLTGRSTVQYAAANVASSITTDVSGFGGILTVADTTVQAALDTLDDKLIFMAAIMGTL